MSTLLKRKSFLIIGSKQSYRPKKCYGILKYVSRFPKIKKSCIDGSTLFNNSNGFVREAELSSGVSVQTGGLKSYEFYTPSLVVWNKGSSPVSVNIGYLLNDYSGSWPEYIIEPNSNLAFRTSLSHLAGLQGSHKIVWYFNGFVLEHFCWTVD